MSSATLANIIRANSPGVGRDEEGNRYYRTVCTRCGGQGYIRGYEFNQAGVCFKCGGHGNLGEWVAESEWAVLQAKKEAAAIKRQEAKERKIAREAQANLARVEEAFPGVFDGFDPDTAPFFVKDIRAKALRFGNLSEAQAYAVRKALAPKPAREEATLTSALPVGRGLLTGRILSEKTVDSPWGAQVKITLQGAGGWKVYGTRPAGLEGAVGDEVSFTATVEAGREAGFGFFSRPKA